ncbi:MAG: Eco57I restriction-modification methylase domain-containing protein [Bacteroides fragilis]|nr:Eco57I restriction-modification methylase domain-containing protein [Bacteroides fragilis]
MKFDFVIGNPPYQENISKESIQAKPVYNIFVTSAKEICSESLVMIIPSRWFAGGMGLDGFRNEMISDKKIKKIVDYPNGKECFPNTSISGGVCYFARVGHNVDSCEFVNVENGKENSLNRPLDEFPVLVRSNSAVSVIRKIIARDEGSIQNNISPISPFGLSTKVRGKSEKEKGQIVLHSSNGVSYIDRDIITKTDIDLESYKVLISQTSGEHAGEPSKDGRFRVLTSSMKVMYPNEACTHSYIYLSPFENEKSAEYALKYMKTRFVRFLILQALTSIHLTKATFVFVPMQDFSKSSDVEWESSILDIDKQLYKKYGLSEEEIAFIESKVKEME